MAGLSLSRHGLGLRGRAPFGWSPKQLGATWVFDPSKLSLSGSNITSAADAGGSGITLTAGTGAQPVTATSPFGATSIRTGNTLTRLTSTTGGPTGGAAWHLVWLGQVLGWGGGSLHLGTFLQIGAPADTQNFGIGANASQIQLFGNNYNSGTSSYLPTWESDLTRVRMIEVQYDGAGGLSYWLNGALLASASHTFSISSAEFGFQGWYTESLYPVLDARTDSAAVKTGGLFTRAQLHQFVQYERARLGGGPRFVAFFGDSYTAGGAMGTTPAHYFPVATRANQTGSVAIIGNNQGVSGQRTDQILARLQAFAGPATHIHWLGGVNDITQAQPGGQASTGDPTQDAALIYAVEGQACARAHALGCKFIIGTSPQWNLTTYQDQVRVALNTLRRANTIGADKVADYALAMDPYNQANFGDAPAYIHPNDASYDTYLGPTAYAAIVAAG